MRCLRSVDSPFTLQSALGLGFAYTFFLRCALLVYTPTSPARNHCLDAGNISPTPYSAYSLGGADSVRNNSSVELAISTFTGSSFSPACRRVRSRIAWNARYYSCKSAWLVHDPGKTLTLDLIAGLGIL
jgi:hypothetical protein